jgi:hypothetical protein
MYYRPLIICLSLMFSAASTPAAEPSDKQVTASFAFDANYKVCTLTIRNVSSEDVTILDAFNKAGGMSQDFPMGTNVRFKDTGWIDAYLISSFMQDHGPMLIRDRASSRIVTRPPQKDAVIHAGDSLSRKFSVSDLLTFVATQGQKPSNVPFQLQVHIHVAQGDNYKALQPIASEWISNDQPSKQ